MELGKYKLAMRPKKYLTREFVVYKTAPEAMDDVIEENPPYEAVMPSGTPPMDNYMPEIPGMEDPSLQQIELADGGVVEREEFAGGSEPVFASEKEIESFKKEMKKKYPGLSVSEGLTNGGRRQIRIRYAKRFGSERKPAFEKSRYLMPTKKNLQILREDAASFVKKAKEKGFEIISDPYELRAKQGLEKTKDQQKLFNDILEKVKQGKNFKYDTLAEKEIYRKLSTNIYKHNSEVGRNLGKGVPFLRNILEEDVDKVLNKINNLPGLRDLNRGDIQYLIRQSYPAGSKQRLEAFKNFKNYERVATEVRNKFGLQFQLEHPLSRKAIERSGAGGIKESLLRVKAVPKVFNDFKNKYDVRLNEIQKNLLNPALRPQATEQLKSLNQIGKLMFEGYDVGELTTTGKVKKYGSDPFIKTDLVEGLKQSLSLNNQVKENIVKYKPQLTPLFESAGFKSTKLLERGEKLAPIAKQTQILNFIEKLNPTEKEVISKFGNKIASGLDPTDALKMLPEKEYQIMKGAMSKVGNLATMGARGAQELLVGTGPLGIGLTALISLPLAINELSEGARGSEAIQNTISDLTFGLTPRSDERIIKEIGGESAVKGMEIQKNIDDYRSITQEINNLENQMRDPSFLSLSPDDQDRIQSSLIQNEEALKEKENFLIPRIKINKKGEIESLEYEDYLKADNKRQLEREIISKAREQQSDIYDLGGEALREEEYVRPEASLLLDPLRKTFVGNQPKQTTYPSVMQGTVGEPVDNIIDRNFAYAVGGRVGFKKGSKDKDSPVIPISPLTDLPQNESKRDFLKGMGAVGLGAVALGSGLLKLGKAAAPISEITKIVKGTTAPSWMDSLITKILKEGIELKSDPNSNVLIKKVKFKNPKTGVEEEATLTFDKQKNSYEIEYSSDETVGGKYGDKVFLKVEPEYVYDPQLQKMVPTGKHKFNAIEAEPEIVNPDGDIEMTGENVASKIIDLRSDISGLKSYVTGEKGLIKK
jgi:hypothetical protein